jgi:GcrA cell cycle regulator
MCSASTDAPWNDETISRLRALWDEGLSTAEIGRRLGTTKNAVVGKAHRLDLPQRPTPIRRAGSGKPRPPPRPRAPRLSDLAPLGCLKPAPAAAPRRPPAPSQPPLPRPTPAPSAPPIPLGKVLCCWPIGEASTADFRFCDAPAVAGKPYCEEHCKLAYRSPGRALDVQRLLSFTLPEAGNDVALVSMSNAIHNSQF